MLTINTTDHAPRNAALLNHPHYKLIIACYKVPEVRKLSLLQASRKLLLKFSFDKIQSMQTTVTDYWNIKNISISKTNYDYDKLVMYKVNNDGL